MTSFWNRSAANRKSQRSQSKRSNRRKRRSSGRRLRSETLETRQLLAANLFHNEAIPEDVNQDGQVSSLDALMIINQINRQEREGDGQRGRGMMTDVNNDGRDTAADALMVINRLQRQDFDRQELARPRGETDDASDNELNDASNEEADRGMRDERGDAVLAWNDLFGELLVADESQQNPGYASRAMAMLNLAIYDAVTLTEGNADDAFYEYDVELDADANLRAQAVASQAAYTVLSSLYPEQQAMIDDARAEVLGRGDRSGDAPGTDAGASIDLGTEIGNAIIAARANDGYDADIEYSYGDQPGDFQPDPLNPDVPVWGPAWGSVEPFAISGTDDFVPSTTPPLDSATYAESYNEVLELGSVDSETRTADQTEAGIFWAYDRTGLGTPMALFNDVLETISQQQGNTFAENAALYAQASVAMADAGVVAWETKFSEQFWRPVTAIHDGDTDGNPDTEADPDWTALGAPDGGDDIVGFTPQFPTYVSGHATFGGALFGAIREFYGTDDIAFDLTSRELEILMENPELEAAYGLDLDDAVRSFDSLSEAMAENGRSRVYLGIHFDFDDLVGQEVGQAVATSVASEFVVPEIDRGPRDGEGPSDGGGPGDGGGPVDGGGPGMDDGPGLGNGEGRRGEGRRGDRGPDNRGPGDGPIDDAPPVDDMPPVDSPVDDGAPVNGPPVAPPPVAPPPVAPPPVDTPPVGEPGLGGPQQDGPIENLPPRMQPDGDAMPTGPLVVEDPRGQLFGSDEDLINDVISEPDLEQIAEDRMARDRGRGAPRGGDRPTRDRGPVGGGPDAPPPTEGEPDEDPLAVAIAETNDLF